MGSNPGTASSFCAGAAAPEPAALASPALGFSIPPNALMMSMLRQGPAAAPVAPAAALTAAPRLNDRKARRSIPCDPALEARFSSIQLSRLVRHAPHDTIQPGETCQRLIQLQQADLVSGADRQNLRQPGTHPGGVRKISRHTGVRLA